MAAAPFVHLPRAGDLTGEDALRRAVFDGDLGRIKGLVKSLIKENGDPATIFCNSKDASSVLHLAAYQGHLEVCKYLVEELGGDVNAPAVGAGGGGSTPFMASCHSGDVPTVRYFLDHGGDLMKPDLQGRTVLHHAVGAGSCKVTEFLLSKGIPVDIDYGQGTPLYVAATNEQDKTVKILLDHHANPNTIVKNGMQYPLLAALIYRSLKCMKLLIKGSIMTPLVFATEHGGYTNFIRFLLSAGADPNIPDDLGRLPIEHAAVRDCKEEVEMLFPFTNLIPNVRNWSIDGVISHAKIEANKPHNVSHAEIPADLAKNLGCPSLDIMNSSVDQQGFERRKIIVKSQADTSFKQKDYKTALKLYDMAIGYGESATLYANRSICKLAMGDGEGALSDARRCRMLRPKWAKACYRQGAAHMLLKEYKQACDALVDAQKLDPGNAEVERELSKAMELMKTS